MIRRSIVFTCLAVATAIPRPAAQISIQMGGTPGGPMQIGGPAAAPMPPGTGTILGRAVEAGTTRPVAGAVVVLTMAGSQALRVMADPQGQFAFRDLPPGRFSLTATRPGYTDGAYGRLRPAGPTQSVELTADQHVTEIAIPLWKHGVITGRVLDERGEPIVGTSVRVLKRTMVAGRRQYSMGAITMTDDRGIYRLSSLEPADYLVVVPMTQASSIDSLIQSLGIPPPPPPPPGGAGGGGVNVFAARVVMNGQELSVSSMDSATPPAGNGLTYSTEFYPAAGVASRAQPVAVTSGDERSGVDFQLKPVRAVNVSGRIVAAGVQNTSGVRVTMVPADSEDLLTPIEVATAAADGNGAFTFTNVPPGQYTLRVLRTPPMGPRGGDTMVISGGGAGERTMVTREVFSMAAPGGAAPPLPTEPTLWAEAALTVAGSDVSDVAVPLRPGLKISGRVEFSGAAQPPTPEQIRTIGITLDPADGRTAALAGTVRGRVEPDGSFTTMGVPAGKYLMRVTAPGGGWSLRSAIANGQDISDVAVGLEQGDATGVVISFTDRVAEVGGIVNSAAGQPDSGAAVFLFPSDRSTWLANGSAPRRQRNVRTSSNGSYTIGNVPPGDYFIVAVSDAATADWPGADFLSALSRSATRISVGDGDGEKKQQSLTTTVIR